MKITRVTGFKESLELSRPYVIATRRIDAVELFFVRLEGERGVSGLGSASPNPHVTGETPERCEAALSARELDWLVGRDVRELGGLCREAGDRLARVPAARAAVDMALYDLFSRQLGLPLVEFLGRCHASLPTSITIGIMSTEAALEEADEYLGRGFVCLKVKIGLDLEQDIERVRKLRERVGPAVLIRVDGNQGYSVQETLALGAWLERLDIELIEQPLPADAVDEMRNLPAALRRKIAADESLLDVRDALRLAADPPACGIYNIKIMKCGGITPALSIAAIAATAGCEVMWGCNDESRISIAAALHAAYASPATRYIDLDGSFDLARDVAEGGFEVRDGRLWTTDAPGLGV